ncbi:MAG: hypothetical protein KJ697_00695 [Nanoarchaeota archaeon]|nr:hypothetical protein [Nanoarchaeota archaeon]MBU4124549.1 hypothetical protein [Nanoarchaeota archaeon]
MDDVEFKRFEDKQKLSNLMIEKRFATLEITIDELKTKLEKDSLSENLPKDINDLKNMVNILKEEKKKDMEQLIALVGSTDISDVKKDFSEMSKILDETTGKINDISVKFEEQSKDVEMVKERVVNSGSDERILLLSMRIKQIEASIESLKVQIASVVENEMMKPIIID